MTVVTISDGNPRSIKAVQIAAGTAQWLKCRARDGQKAYGVPSSCQPGRFYLVTTATCDCPDAQRHAGQACKHQLAVRLHVALVNGAKPSQGPRQAISTASDFVASHLNARGETVYLPRRQHGVIPASEIVRED